MKVINNAMQSGYAYPLTMPYGDMSDQPLFKPDLTPKQMLEMGVFGGKYFNDVLDTNEYPSDWFDNAKLSITKNPKLNFYKVNASESLAAWKFNGWIHEQDPRGWFEWYCRFYMGRRSDDDIRQIKRHINYKRFLGALRRYSTHPCDGKGLKTKQSLLHWGYDARKLSYYKTFGEQINEL